MQEVFPLEATIEKNEQFFKTIAAELNLPLISVRNVIALLEDGNTVPFIARYRKEKTGALDEVQIRNIMERWTYLVNLQQRKEEVIRLIDAQGKLTEELQKKIEKALKLQEVEDLYRPYKQKRRTKATIAKEKGLEPLAEWMMSFPTEGSLEEKAEEFISEEKKVTTIEDAIAGAKDIIAEQVSDDAESRKWIRRETFKTGIIESSVKDAEKDEKNVYEMYYEYSEPVAKIVPHRVLALNRGVKEEVLRVSIKPDTDSILNYLYKKWIKNCR